MFSHKYKSSRELIISRLHLSTFTLNFDYYLNQAQNINNIICNCNIDLDDAIKRDNTRSHHVEVNAEEKSKRQANISNFTKSIEL